METNILGHLGLTQGEIKIYQVLLEQGPLPIAELITATGLKKGDCYNKTADLISKELIEEYESEKKKHFRLADPSKLEDIAKEQYKKAKKVKNEVESLIPEILSTYTLTYHVPGTLFFEGEEAMRRVLDDTLTAKDEVLQYADTNPFINQYKEINASYVKRRSHLKQHKRVLLPDIPASRRVVKSQNKNLFTGRFLPEPTHITNVTMYIYDNKIAYLTLQQDKMIGVIIEDAILSTMHRQLFNFTWDKAIKD